MDCGYTTVRKLLEERESNSHSREGFTLLEILISVFVFSLFTATFVSSLWFCNATARLSTHSVTACNLARQKIEWLKGKSFPNIALGLSADDYEVSQYSEEGVQLDTTISADIHLYVEGRDFQDITDSDGDGTSDGDEPVARKYIKVEVEWTENGKQYDQLLETLVATKG